MSDNYFVATFPAGEYWIGDLCYVMHPEWNEMCDLFFAGRTDHGCNEGKFTLADGRTVFAGTTAYGDGVYRDNRGNDYGVDAGLLGMIAVKDIVESEQQYLNGGNVFQFDAAFQVSVERGLFNFGDIEIDTREYEDETDYYDDRDYDDYGDVEF